jgi:hypothetical protein
VTGAGCEGIRLDLALMGSPVQPSLPQVAQSTQASPESVLNRARTLNHLIECGTREMSPSGGCCKMVSGGGSGLRLPTPADLIGIYGNFVADSVCERYGLT